MKSGWSIIIICFVLVVAICCFLTVVVTLAPSATVELRLVNLLSDQLPYYEFKVNGKEIAKDQKVKTWRSFEVEVFKVEIDEKTLIDKVNIISLLENRDEVTAGYDGKDIFIFIKHVDGFSRKVLINNN